jgi:hypothetical protein
MIVILNGCPSFRNIQLTVSDAHKERLTLRKDSKKNVRMCTPLHQRWRHPVKTESGWQLQDVGTGKRTILVWDNLIGLCLF